MTVSIYIHPEKDTDIFKRILQTLKPQASINTLDDRTLYIPCNWNQDYAREIRKAAIATSTFTNIKAQIVGDGKLIETRDGSLYI